MKNYSGSFPRRITRRVILTVFFTMTVIAGIITHILVKQISDQGSLHYQSVMEMTNEEMDIWLSMVAVSAMNIEDEIKYNLQSPDMVFMALADEMRLSPYIKGAAVGFKPDYFPEQGRWFEPYALRGSDGEITTKQIGSAHHDYFNAEWYTVTLERNAGYWTNPYFDEEGAGAMLCSYAVPLIDLDNNTVGVLGLDLELVWLQNKLQENDKIENSRGISRFNSGNPKYAIFSFILGHNGEYIVHPDQSRILTKTYFDFAPKNDDGDYVEAGRDMLAGNTGVTKLTINNQPSFVFYGPLKSTGWSMGIVVPAAMVFLPGLTMGLLILLLIGLGVVIIAAVCRMNVRSATNPLVRLAESAGEVAKGNFDARLPEIHHHDEIRNLRDSFEDMQHSLATYVDQVTTASAQRAAIESELGVARNIQMSLVPKTFPPFPERNDLDIYASLTPARAIGGDLYDFFILDDNLMFCIGDVSGKGVPASLVMASVSTQFRSIANHHQEPDIIVTTLNSSLSIRNESMMFSTLFAGALNLKTGRLVYCNAGHNLPLLLGDGVRELDAQPNLPIGIDPTYKFGVQSVTLTPGTTILLFTDGLTEAENCAHELYGDQRLAETVTPLCSKGAEELVNEVINSVHAFVAGAEQSDDLTILAIKWQTK